ncbi:MAG: RNA-binding protein [Phenylobacterium zucineum]|nr:MAG: RNA-binding protein [Phenylobacterium zucineum]
MPKGPNGQKRPADAIGLAVLIGKIATGEVEDTPTDPAKTYHTEGGKKGGPARAAKLTAEQRSEIARKAAARRWSDK